MRKKISGFKVTHKYTGPLPSKIVVYRSNYGRPLSCWDRFINNLWYHVAEKEEWQYKIIYYPLKWLERMYYRVFEV